MRRPFRPPRDPPIGLATPFTARPTAHAAPRASTSAPPAADPASGIPPHDTGASPMPRRPSGLGSPRHDSLQQLLASGFAGTGTERRANRTAAGCLAPDDASGPGRRPPDVASQKLRPVEPEPGTTAPRGSRTGAPADPIPNRRKKKRRGVGRSHDRPAPRSWPGRVPIPGSLPRSPGQASPRAGVSPRPGPRPSPCTAGSRRSSPCPSSRPSPASRSSAGCTTPGCSGTPCPGS